MLTQLLRELRLAAGLKQTEAAEALGIAQTGISDIETSDRGLDLLVVRDLVQIYGADWLKFIAELERRLATAPQPAGALIRKTPSKKSK